MKNRTYFILFEALVVLIVGFVIASGCKLIGAGAASRPESFSLRFNDDGKFKIAQFTDIHWENDSVEKCASAAQLIRHVLKEEHPGLAVLTGDIVIQPSAEGWKAVTALFTEAGIPFAVVMGNHDDEAEWSRERIFDFLETVDGFVGSKGPENVSGVGNYIIGIRSASSASIASAGTSSRSATSASSASSGTATSGSSGSTAALLYFLDSNSYGGDEKISTYGWIRFDQIAWYREQSRRLTALNGGNPFPALAFFHIPLPEYAEVAGKELTVGIKKEEECSPKINTGMLAAFVEMKDVMGVFVGHDHDNNTIGIHKGIALAYGQKTGFSSYGSIGRGSRIIELREGERSFNTWIRTLEGTAYPYNYPSGKSFQPSN